MKLLTIASLVSGLCALWLSNYGAEGTEVKIMKCDVDNPMPGAAKLQEIGVADGKITGSKLDVQQEINPGVLSAHVIINNEDDDTMFEQTIDLCSMSSNDLFKNYFLAFEQPEFNEGNCPLPPGAFSSTGFDLEVGDAPEGTYKGIIEVMEGPNTIININCEAKME